MTDGSMHEMRVDCPKGHPDRPMSVADFDAKLRDCVRVAALPFPADTVERLRAAVDNLAAAPDVAALVHSVTVVREPA